MAEKTQKQDDVYAVVVYILNDGREERFEFSSKEGLENEIKWANAEHERPTFRIEYPN